MPVVHPAEVWKESGRYHEDRPGAGPVQGPRRAGHGPRDDPRGGRRDPPARHRPELPPAADDRLPLPDEVPRRAALPWRPHPRPRVRDEGLVLAATSTTPGSTSATASTDAAYERDLPAARARCDRRRRRTSGSWAARAPTSSWSSTSSARTRSSCATTATTRTTSRSPRSASPTRSPRTLLPMEDVETPDATTIEALATFLDIPKSKTAKAAFFVTGDGRFVVADRARRLRRQRDEARQHAQGARRPPAGDASRRSRPAGMEAGYGSPLGARDARGRRRRARRPVAEPRRRREPGRLARAERQRPARLHARHRRRDHERPRGRPLPEVRLAGASSGRGSRSATSSSSARTSRTPSGRCTSARTASATRSSWARTGSGSGGTWPASSRPTTTRRASPGPTRSRRTPRTSCRSAPAATPNVLETAERLHALAKDAGREILYDDRDESPGVKFTDAELLGMPWILTVSPALARGGRRRGHPARHRRAPHRADRRGRGVPANRRRSREPPLRPDPRVGQASAATSSMVASSIAVPSSVTIVSRRAALGLDLGEERLRVAEARLRRVVDALDRERDGRRDRRPDRDLADPVDRAALLERRVRPLLEGRRLDDDVGEDLRVDPLEGGREAALRLPQRRLRAGLRCRVLDRRRRPCLPTSAPTLAASRPTSPPIFAACCAARRARSMNDIGTAVGMDVRIGLAPARLAAGSGPGWVSSVMAIASSGQACLMVIRSMMLATSSHLSIAASRWP